MKSKEQKNLLNIKKEEADGGNDKASETLPEDLNGGVDFLFCQRTENKNLSGCHNLASMELADEVHSKDGIAG